MGISTSAATTHNELSLAESAYRRVRDMLITLEIRPGEPINEGILATELEVGRTPLREALKRLEHDHLVQTYPRRGTFATIVDITELSNISEIRLALEPLAARRAADSASETARTGLRQLADRIAALDMDSMSASDIMRFDIDVHRAVYAATGNGHLEDVLIRYDNLAVRIWFLVLDKMPPVSGHVRGHTELLRAIADGDADLAVDLTTSHVADFQHAIRTVL
ncbi:GntR family transcriptional regulator [Spelaeicoccus albus]|uniref:DNA-binding GntR family transcriptional regulator n=1 Tax=Spelaeicoccus albus TaxID=1280376 RepID=A0A7Z0AAA0_9MICO|nr:GntR family transcriptional regulator [Spelaeicoccus albus]NYI67187.1 DNA-binding GntR family transcriptional regulator [Spelaeicoccus albus]